MENRCKLNGCNNLLSKGNKKFCSRKCMGIAFSGEDNPFKAPVYGSTKGCSKCKKDLPLSSFSSAGRGNGRLRAYCKDCQKEYQKNPEYQARYKELSVKYNANRRSRYNSEQEKFYKIKRNYNMSKEQYNDLLEKQTYSCAVCKARFNDALTPHVDHDHSCCSGGKSCGRCVRGLLCSNCNRGLGMFEDDPLRLRVAAQYIQHSTSQTEGIQK